LLNLAKHSVNLAIFCGAASRSARIVAADLSRPLLKLAAVAFAVALLSTPAFASVGKTGTERAPLAARTPGPIAGEGYHLAWRDEFKSFRTKVWSRRIWYDDRPQKNWSKFQYVSGGVLHLRTGRSYAATCKTCAPGDWPINTVTTLGSHSFKQGYFEVRMRWTKGAGAWPGFWLYSTQHARDNDQCATKAGEIDVFEGQGTEPRVYYGTVHSNTNGCAPEDQQNGNNYHPVGKNLTTKFHRYGALWTQDRITWYLDGKRLMSAPTYSTDDQRMFLLLQMWIGGWTKDPNSTTPDILQTQVDWVRVWQH
jgi:beta-glucanase (GH16 family)